MSRERRYPKYSTAIGATAESPILANVTFLCVRRLTLYLYHSFSCSVVPVFYLCSASISHSQPILDMFLNSVANKEEREPGLGTA